MQVTDPVCGMTLDSGKAAAKEIWQGEIYHLCSASCHDQTGSIAPSSLPRPAARGSA